MGQECYFKLTIAENFSNPVKNVDIQVREPQRPTKISDMLYPKRTT